MAVLARMLIVAALVMPAIARADEDPEVKATELFEQGRALVKADMHAEACPLFAQSLALRDALGTELNLALCLSKIGKLLEAQRRFESILKKTEAPDQAHRRQYAVDGLKDIAARMPKLQIERGDVPTTATVWIDGVELVDTTDAIPLDPGEHVVEAEGATKQTVMLEEGKVAEVILVPGKSESVPVEPGTPVTQIGWLEGDRRPIYIAAGGGALLLAGTITGILTLTKKSDGLALCDDSDGTLRCGSEAGAKLDTARTLSHVTTALFLLGGAAVATGVVWKYRERTGAASKPDRDVVTGWVTGTSAGFVWERSW